jgi:hypothetical protein
VASAALRADLSDVAAVLLLALFVVSFVATSVAIFADQPLVLALAFVVAVYALKNDLGRGVSRLRPRR